MRTLTFVHQHSLQVVPDLLLLSVRVRTQELAHVELERVRDCVLRLAPLERVVVEDEAENREVQDLRVASCQSSPKRVCRA